MQRISTAVTVRNLLRRLRADEARGAREIAPLAARLLGLLLAGPGGSTWEARLQRETAALLETQPAMAPVLYLANAVWLALEGPADAAERRARARAALTDALALLAASAERAARLAAEILGPARTVVTISRSSTVLAALAGIAARHPLWVIVGEGRPALEGRRLAASAAAVGCRVTLVADAALPGQARGADAVLVGADAILRRGTINKVGTSALLLAAREAAVPSYVLADRSKLVPGPLAPLLILPARDPGRLWRDPPRNVSLARTDFESIPLSLCTAVLTEEGAAAPRTVARRLAALPAARLLRRLARRCRPLPQGRAEPGRR